MKNRACYIMLSMFICTCAVILPIAISSKLKKADYSVLEGTWVDMQSEEYTGIAAHFKPKGEYTEYRFYDKDEKLTPGTQPESLVWTGHGTYTLSHDVLVIKVTDTSDNMPPFNKSFHFIRLETTEMELLDTAGGKRTIWKKLK